MTRSAGKARQRPRTEVMTPERKNALRKAQALYHEKAAYICADAEECRMPQRHKPCKAHNDIQAQSKDRVNAHHDEDMEDIYAHLRDPMMPRGRMMSTSTSAIKAKASLKFDEMYAAPRFSAMPRTSPPMMAPGMDPTPPKYGC